MYDDTFDENDLITICLFNTVKEKIKEKFNSNVEEFIEKEFPQDKELEIFLFKYRSGKKDETIALKTPNSDFMLLIDRSEDYMVCFDIQKRPEIIKDKNNDFIEKKCELKIPIEFDKRHYNNSTIELLDDIEDKFENIKTYKTPSLTENEEYKKWYIYLTLLEKLIDEKDFYFEADITYIDKNAKVDISNIDDKELIDKIKIAINESFLFYKLDEVDTTKPLHEWDEKNNRDRNFGNLKKNKNKELTFKLDDEFIKKFTEKSTNENKETEKSFNLPSKLILRVSYFRDQFQLKTLKRGLDQIQKHPLKSYLFGDKKIAKIDDEELENFKIRYNSKVLNDRQKEAIKKALVSNELFMIQGPPGTGKTEVISELAYQEVIRGKKVLIVSQANMAVDNAIQRLNHPSLYPIRIIRADYEPEDGDSLPVEANIDTFYQKRIIKTLEDTLDKQSSELKLLEDFLKKQTINDKFIEIIAMLSIDIPNNIDLKDEDDKDDFLRIVNNDKNLEIIQNRVEELSELKHFQDIQKDFLEDLKNDDKQDIKEEKEYLKSNYINKVNIYGATLFETGKYSFKDKRFDVVIVDEVSKAMPPELVLPILKGDKLILVGDHKQLPPIISNELSLEDLAFESDISLDSLDFDTTVFEKLIMNNPHSYVMLNKQYRMHPHIQMVINQFYVDENKKGGLECGLKNPDKEKAHNLEDKIFKDKHLVWLKTKESDKEEKPQGGTSFINTAEIKGVDKTLEFLNREYGKLDIIPTVGVITFYGKQLRELTKLEKQAFWKLKMSERNYPNIDLRFGTVDRFQGQEKDIIIASLVRNNKEHNVGFAKKPNRVNVAFSRAKNLLIIVGNANNFIFGKNEKSAKMYGKIFNIAKKFGTVKAI
jgi:superfamily I DNA and/or RNA helicase